MAEKIADGIETYIDELFGLPKDSDVRNLLFNSQRSSAAL